MTSPILDSADGNANIVNIKSLFLGDSVLWRSFGGIDEVHRRCNRQIEFFRRDRRIDKLG